MRRAAVPIYTISNFLENNLDGELYANDFLSHLQNDFILVSHRHNFYLSVLFTKGTGTHEIDFNKYPIIPGSTFFILPGHVHTWQLSSDIDGYIVFHTKEFFDLNFTKDKVSEFPFYRSFHNIPLLTLPPEELVKIAPIYKEIVDEYKTDKPMKFQKLRSLIYWLYIELSRLYVPKEVRHLKNSVYQTKFLELEELLNNNFRTIKFPKDYAELMHTSEQQLNRICKVCTGQTITQLIINRILLEAKRLLTYTENTVAEIAFELGYLDVSYFVRFFKKNTGFTPLEFTRNNRNK